MVFIIGFLSASGPGAMVKGEVPTAGGRVAWAVLVWKLGGQRGGIRGEGNREGAQGLQDKCSGLWRVTCSHACADFDLFPLL